MIKKTLCFTNPAYLSLHQCQLVIRLPEVVENENLSNVLKEQAERTIPVEDIGVVVLDHRRITITSGALDALLENNCAVITCNAQGHPVGLLLPLSGNTLQSERFREQIASSLPLRKQLWQQTIKQKITNQATVLRSVTGNDEKCMQVWAEQVRSGDPDNIEARAAAHYWQHLFPELPHFVRAREGEPPNNLLNYGYAILRAVVARALVGSGLLPTLGIHHHNRYNAYCLADDIMEPYRPYVDRLVLNIMLFAILQKYEFSSKSQHPAGDAHGAIVVCDTAKVRVFKQITTKDGGKASQLTLFAILQKYEFSSKSQQNCTTSRKVICCLRYCKSTSFQANHNNKSHKWNFTTVVCDTAKVRVFKQITTDFSFQRIADLLFAILQKYEFSSKSQQITSSSGYSLSCLRYCKSTSFQANHNPYCSQLRNDSVVCDTAKVRVFKQITTNLLFVCAIPRCLRYCKSTSFQANHNNAIPEYKHLLVVCDTAKVRVFKQITTPLNCV